MNDFQKDILALIKSGIYGCKVVVSENFDWQLAIQYGNNHKILPLLYVGAYNSNIKIPTDVNSIMFFSVAKYYSYSEKQMYELSEIKQIFTDNGIKYVALKGSNLKKYYPSPELRPMGDIDILIDCDQYNTIKSIMQQMGYREEKESNHELIWVKDSIMVELHKKLIPSYNEDYYSYFKEGWQLVYSTDADSTEFVFSPEDEFIYLFVHFTKHYRDGGIGLIHLTDIYLFLQSNKIINKEYIETVLDDLHILEFYKNIILTIEMCFEYGQESYISNHIIDVIFNSGSYGTFESQTLSTVVKKTRGVKRKKSIRIVYLMKRVFMPYKEMCARHVLLKKIPFLLPFFWLYRVFSVCLFKRENIQKEITKLNISKSDQVLAYYDSLKLVGLDFYFKD